MDLTIFIFFVLPLATILLAIVLQKILRSPALVALTFFAIYLIVAFVSFVDTLAEALVAVIIYTLIAYITAYIVMILCRCRKMYCRNGNTDNTSNFINLERNCLENNNSIIDTITEPPTLSETSLGVEKQYLNNATSNGSMGRRNNIQRRMYGRFY